MIGAFVMVGVAVAAAIWAFVKLEANHVDEEIL